MDELDVKIFRALVSESSIAPVTIQVRSSLREIARKLGADDMTIRNRYKKLQDSGCMSVWRLSVNPSLFSYRVVDIIVEAEPESAKPDMMRKLRLVHGIVRIMNHYGKALQLLLLYDTDESRSRTVELISRITNTEKMTFLRLAWPRSMTKRLTETDIAIISALAMDARKPYTVVAKELGLSSRTVKNRLNKLQAERTLMAYPEFVVGDVPGLIPVEIPYAYSNSGVKGAVDSAVLSHFDATFLYGTLSDPEQALLVLNAPSIAGAQRYADWLKQQPGVASAQLLVPVECVTFPEKFGELVAAMRAQQVPGRS